MAYLLTQETCAIEQNSSNRDGKKEDRKEAVTEVSMKLCLVFVCQDVILWFLSMTDIFFFPACPPFVNTVYNCKSFPHDTLEW